MSSGGKSSGGSSYDPTRAYQAGYGDYNPDVDWQSLGTINQSHPDYQAFGAGWDMARKDAEASSFFDDFSFEMPEMPTFAEGPTEEEIQAQKDQAEFDSLLSDRFDRATEAAAGVNTTVENSMARAQLYGLTYDITDEERGVMVNNEFAGLWGVENEERLTTLSEILGTEIDTGGVIRGEEPKTTPVKEDTSAGGPVKSTKKVAGISDEEGLLNSVSVF